MATWVFFGDTNTAPLAVEGDPAGIQNYIAQALGSTRFAELELAHETGAFVWVNPAAVTFVRTAP